MTLQTLGRYMELGPSPMPKCRTIMAAPMGVTEVVSTAASGLTS